MKPHIAAMQAAFLSALDGGFKFPSGSRGISRASGPGWSNAHVKRMAAKARHIKRHRAASRGKP